MLSNVNVGNLLISLGVITVIIVGLVFWLKWLVLPARRRKD